MQVWNVLHVARWNTGRKKLPKICHLGTITQLCRAVSLQLRRASTIRKKLVKQQYLLHMSLQYGELQPTNGWDRFGSLGNPSKFQWVSKSWLHCCNDIAHRRSTKLCTMFGHLLGCLGISWSGILYIHFRGLLPPPWRKLALCKTDFTSKSCVLLYWHHYCAALQQRASAKHCGVVEGMEWLNFRRGRHLYSAWPSRWASAHILVLSCSKD